MNSRSTQPPVGVRRTGWIAALAATAMLAAGVAAAPAPAATTGYSQTAHITIDDHSVRGSNSAPITVTDPIIPNVGPATPYPSQVTVAARGGTITDVDLSLLGLNHTSAGDLDVLLVGPSGQRVVVMSDAGGFTDLVGVNLRLDDEAVGALPFNVAIASGTYRPANYAPGEVFPLPAPDITSAGTSLTAFDGDSPNGTWSLYIFDDSNGDAGTITGGWSLDIATTIVNPAAANPYPSTITVSGALNGITDVNVGLKSFDHTFPFDVDVLVVGPGGQMALILSDTGGTTDVVNADLVFDDQAATPPTSSLVSGTFKPVNDGPNDVFPALASDAATAGSALSVFNGTNPNGVWRLFVMDDSNGDAGDISGGWTLQISTGDAPARPVITSPKTGNRDRDGVLTFVGKAPAGSTVRLTEAGVLKGSVAAGAAGAWTLIVGGVAKGSHTYTATATDAALNASAASTAVTVVVDKTAPSVKATSPANHKKRVRAKANVTVAFTEAVRSRSLTKSNVYLTKAGSTKKIKATLRYAATTHRLVLNPKAKLSGGTKYRVTVSSKVLDLAGNPLDQKSKKKGAQAKTWTFTTR